MKRPSLLALGSVVGLVALAGQWYYDDRIGVDTRAHDRYAQDVRSLQAFDARLNEQVLQARQSLVIHYDDISRTTGQAKRALANLQQTPRFLAAEAGGEVRDALAAASALQTEKVRLIEQFKGQNAVLRNSARFFPVAAAELREKLSGQPELLRAVDDALVTSLQYVQLPSGPRRQQAESAIAALAVASVPVDLQSERDVVVLHARVLVERSGKVTELTHAVLGVAIPRSLDSLEQKYEQAVRTALLRAELRREMMFLTALFVVLALAIDLVQRFRRAAQFERVTATRLEVANKTLQREADSERELSDLKNRFISMTSHEFRTPLSVILSSTELLEAYGERWQRTKRSDHYGRIKTAVNTMRELLDAVLVIGKSDAGKLEFVPFPIDFDRFVRECVEAIASTSMRHEFRVEIDTELPLANVDLRLADHVLTNLLSNAVKYAPAGGPIDVRVNRSGDWLVLVVRDRGIGITVEDQARLFDSFHRGKNVGTIAGTGLGLAVVKRAATAHGGAVSVVTAEGEGATFTVRLPAFRDASTEAGAEATGAEGTGDQDVGTLPSEGKSEGVAPASNGTRKSRPLSA